jgi:hypothetical protein
MHTKWAGIPVNPQGDALIDAIRLSRSKGDDNKKNVKSNFTNNQGAGMIHQQETASP